MGVLSFLFGMGMPGLITKDLLKIYFYIKSRWPDENEEMILERVWSLWMTKNEEGILNEDDEDKKIRYTLTKQSIEERKSKFKSNQHNDLFELFMDILYIECEIAVTDGKFFINSAKVFTKYAKKKGIDLSNSFDFYKAFRNARIPR